MINLLSFAPLAPYVVILIVAGVVVGALALWLCLSAVIAAYTLKMATKPVAHSIEEMRQQQIATEHIDIDLYDNKWSKSPFEIDGLHGKIRGETVTNPADNGAKHRVAVICHGHTVNRMNSIKYAMVFYRLGFSIVMYDHCYFGESDGSFTTLGYYERHDLSSIIDFARQTFGQDCVLALHGESMGAVTVLTELGVRSDVDLVVADCPFSNTFNYYCELYRALTHMSHFPVVEMSGSMAKRKYGYDFAKCNPIEDVAQSDVPICFIHGKADTYIHHHHSVDMYKACRNPLSELHLVDEANHACSHMVDNDGYFRIVKNFVEKVLSNA